MSQPPSLRPASTTRPSLTGRFGMASSSHWLATASAQAVLERGGNAFDAAVAGGFVLQVVEPNLNGPAGELVGIFSSAQERVTRVLAGVGPAPIAASIEWFHDHGFNSVPGSGTLATTTPGQFDAWMLLLLDYGTWELADVLQFAIDYARDGFPVTASIHATLSDVAPLLREHWPTSAAAWLCDGAVPEVGSILFNIEYARVLEKLIEVGDQASSRASRIEAARTQWSTGFIAKSIAEFVKVPSWQPSGQPTAGLLSPGDLADYRAQYELPVCVEFRGRTIAKAGAWTQGPALAQILLMLEKYSNDELDPSTPRGIHLILETTKLAMADRDGYFGDLKAPIESLLADDYIVKRLALIGATASPELRPGDVPGFTAYHPPLQEGAGGEATPHKAPEPSHTRGDTCQLDVVDQWGNMIAVTPSGGWLQSSPLIPGLGFALNSRLQQSWLDKSSPSRLKGGKRPRVTLTPTLVLQDNEPIVALGSPGGDGQDQWQLQYLLRTIVCGYTPQEAIDAPAFLSQAFPESFWPRTWVKSGVSIEGRMDEDVCTELVRLGHRVTTVGDWSLGRLSVVTRDPETGLLGAAANPRGAQGYAAGR